MSVAALSYRDRWTVSLGPRGVAEDARAQPEQVVLVPTYLHFADGLRRCRALLSTPGGAVRLVGLGATVEENWPAWLRRSPRALRLSELDGYFPTHKGPLLAELIPQLRAWLDEVLGEVVPGASSSAIFWTTACERLYRPHIEAWLLAAGLHHLHPGDDVTCVDPRWSGFQMLARRRAAAGNPMKTSYAATQQHSTLAGAAWPLLVSGMALAAAGKRSREFLRERPSRRALEKLRAREAQRNLEAGTKQDPRLWIGLTAAFPRASRSVLEMVPPVARESGERLGVLLLKSLEPGLHSTPFFRNADPGPIFPALSAPELGELGGPDDLVGAVEQAVSVATAAELGAVFREAAALSAAAARRAARTPAFFGQGALATPVHFHPAELAKLLTVDVLRAREAHAATSAALSRRSFSGARVVYPHINALNDVAFEQALQAEGATTIDLVHGLSDLSVYLGPGMSFSTVKALWSVAESDALAPFRPQQRCEGGFLPRPLPSPVTRRPRNFHDTRDPQNPLRILVTTNYLASAWGLDPRTCEHYQIPILQAARELLGLGVPMQLRWRPHPGDDPGRVEKLFQSFPMLERSTTPDLDAELRWADVLVTAFSSVALEALFYEMPVFLHDVPLWDETSRDGFDPRRLFGHTTRLVDQLGPCLDLLSARGPQLLLPEEALKKRLFGLSGRPRSIGELLGESIPPLSQNALKPQIDTSSNPPITATLAVQS